MDGGQKNKVSLESGLDVKSADMLVPAGDAKFLHNRQRYQGRYLPTSLRYERDGWAAGWDVYQFKFESNEQRSEPEGFLLVKNKINGNPAYMLVFKKDLGEGKRKSMARVWWNYESSSPDPTVTVTQGERTTEFTAEIEGKQFTVTVDPLTGGVGVSPADFDVSWVLGSDGKYMFTVVDTTQTEAVDVRRLHDALPVTCNGKYVVGEYVSLSDGTHTWRDSGVEVTFDEGAGTVLIDGEEPDAVTITVPDISFQLSRLFEIKGMAKYDVDEWYPSILKTSVGYDGGYSLVARDNYMSGTSSMSVSEGVPFNMWSAHMNKGHLCSEHPSVIDGYIPQWAGIGVEFASADDAESASPKLEHETDVIAAYGLDTDGHGTEAIEWVPVELHFITPSTDMAPNVGDTAWARPELRATDGSGRRFIYGDPGVDLRLLRNASHDGRTVTRYWYRNALPLGWQQMDSRTYYGVAGWYPVFTAVQGTWHVRVQGVDNDDKECYVFDRAVSGLRVSVWDGATRLDDAAYTLDMPLASQQMTIRFTQDVPLLHPHDENAPAAPAPVEPGTVPGDGDFTIPSEQTTDTVTLQFEVTFSFDPTCYSFGEGVSTTSGWSNVFRVTLTCNGHSFIKTGDALTCSTTDDGSDGVEGSISIDDGFYYDSMNNLPTRFSFEARFPYGYWKKGKWPWSSKSWKWVTTGGIDLQDTSIQHNCEKTDVLGEWSKQYRYHKGGGEGDAPGYQCLCITTAYKAYWEAKVTMSDRLTGANLNANIEVEPAYVEDSERWPDDETRRKKYWVDREPDDDLYPRASHRFDVSKQSCDIGDTTFTLKLILTPVETTFVFYTFETLEQAKARWKSSSSEERTDEFIEGYVPGCVLYNDEQQVSNYEQYVSAKQVSPSVSDTNNCFRFQLSGTAYTVRTMNRVSMTVSSSHRYPHDFFVDVLPGLSSFTADTSTDPAGIEVLEESIDLDGQYTLREHVTFVSELYVLVIEHIVYLGSKGYVDELYVVSDGVFDAGGYTMEVLEEHLTDSVLQSSITISTVLDYLFTARVPFIDQAGYTVLEYANGKYAIKAAKSTFEVNTNSLTATAIDGATYDVTRHEAGDIDAAGHGGGYSFSFTSMLAKRFQGIVRGPYKATGCRIVSFDRRTIVVEIDGERYEFDISANGLFDFTVQDRMLFSCYDTRDPDGLEHVIQSVDPSEEMQFLKQQWDTTVATENFWWIDAEHVLCLTKDEFVLKVKASSVEGYEGVVLDDWNGDTFVVESSWPRSDYLGGGRSYGVTCAKGGDTALMWCAENPSESSMALTFYDPLDDMRSWSVTVPLVRHELGTQLNQDNKSMNTYADLQMSVVMSMSRFTSTCVDGHVLFGVHYDSNFNQWAIDIDRASHVFYVQQGYGFVGVDGCLTGGEIPSKYFMVSFGFTGTVQPIDYLKGDLREATSIADFYSIDIEGDVVGSASQQWYITKELTEIVSHLTWNGGGWTAVALPLNNNVAQVYGSPSAVQRTCTDLAPTVSQGFSNLLPVESSIFTALDVILAVTGMPSFYSVFPKINSLVYLQQTMGQYAYVHYNSTGQHQSKSAAQDDSENRVGDIGGDAPEKKSVTTVTQDELSFNVHKITQEGVAASNPNESDLLTMLMSVSTTLSEYGGSTISEKMNEKQNQTSTSDEGKKFSQYFLQNLDSMASSALAVRGTKPTQTSIVTGVMTLDMFYSTSDRQQVCAGPGWVNHNFVAQCVAQSVTSTHLELSQTGAYCLFSVLTMAEMWLQKKVTQLALDGLYKLADISSRLTGASAMGSGVGTLPGSILAAVLTGSAKALEARLSFQDTLCEVLPGLLEMMGADRVNVSVMASKSNHSVDAEGKHKYGSKSEVFMWPCFDCGSGKKVRDESVEAEIQDKPWTLKVAQYAKGGSHSDDFEMGDPKLTPDWTRTVNCDSVAKKWDGNMSYLIANCRGKVTEKELPSDMAYVIGTESFLPETAFRNENIGESEPVFPTAPFQDYIIDRDWQVSQTASVGMTTWISCKDTKVIDGELSNAVITDEFCGLACPYTAVEVKRGVTKEYLRPWAITPQALALNQTGFNCCYEEKAYHAFDGYGYRLVSWVGSSGMNKERQTWQYSFIVNDRFKRSNKMPLNEFSGNFKSDPVLALSTSGEDRVFSLVTVPGEGQGLQAGTIGEDKDVRRYAAPVFSEFVSTLPAVIKTISSINLSVVDGITSLTTENRDLQTAYKAPVSVDFAIGKSMYRYTSEYICALQQTSGVTTLQELVPCLGLEFLGATPYEAYLYSQATRQYYKFTGGTSISVVDMLERFRDVTSGRYDFVNQEVLVPCLATFTRLDAGVEDDEDETDNIMVPRLKDGEFKGEVWPPIETIFNTRSWFRTISLPSGVTYQGPNRCIINRFVYSDYMEGQIKGNYGKWRRVPRERYHPFREYRAVYETVDAQIGDDVEVEGWTHNPFLLVTSPLGLGDEKDCLFEWEVTFCWPVEMDALYGKDDYAVVNLMAECMTPGGKVVAERPVHVFLTKELFTRTGNVGYYSFRYQSRCGAGNRERLHIWSDQYVAVSALQVDVKQVTEKRTEVLTQQVDVQHLNEI